MLGTQIGDGFQTFKTDEYQLLLYARGVWKQIRRRHDDVDTSEEGDSRIPMDIEQSTRRLRRAEAQKMDAQRFEDECKELLHTLFIIFVGIGGYQLIRTIAEYCVIFAIWDTMNATTTLKYDITMEGFVIVEIFILVPIADHIIRRMYNSCSPKTKARAVAIWLLRPENQLFLGKCLSHTYLFTDYAGL